MSELKRPTKRIPCEVYSRVVGYIRPLRNWNVAKQAEFRVRKTYKVEDPDGK